MKPDEERAAETREWMKKAEGDLASAGILMEAGDLDHALFWCQQAAEKSLKAFLVWHDRTFRKTHDLEEIGQACSELDPSLSDLVAEADVLTDYAWRLRYPGEPYTPDQAEAEALLSLARRVFREIEARLPGPARVSPDYGHH